MQHNLRTALLLPALLAHLASACSSTTTDPRAALSKGGTAGTNGGQEPSSPALPGASGGVSGASSPLGGSSSGPGGATTGGAGEVCVGPPDTICRPSGFPFVVATFSYAERCVGDACPLLTQPKPGTLCLVGPEPVPDAHHHFPLIYGTTPTFDAAAEGITQMSFTVDTPPASGVLVEAGMLKGTEPNCFERERDACVAFGFDLPPITQAGPVVATFDDFVQRDPMSPYQTFDSHRLAVISFGVNEGAYEFCVRDFKFMDAEGREVQGPSFEQSRPQ